MKIKKGWENDKDIIKFLKNGLGLTVNKEGEIEGYSGNLRFLNQILKGVFIE